MQDLLHVPLSFCTGSGHNTSSSRPTVSRMEPNGSIGGQSAAAARDKAIVERLVAEYMAHSGLWNPQRQQHKLREKDPLTTEVGQALLALTDEYEHRYKAQLMRLTASWEISADNPRTSFVDVLDAMLTGDCNWGRIITVFIFIGLFSRKCQAQGIAESVTNSDVAEWAAVYIQDKLRPWIQEHGGWMGLVHFYRDGDSSTRLASESGMFKRLLLTAGAGLALLSIGSLLANRA